MVKNGSIECRYHGWQFGKDGKCTRVPSMPVGKTPPGARVHSYPATTRERFIWVWPGDPEQCRLDRGFPAPLKEFTESEWNITEYDLSYDVPYWSLIENLLDPSHLQFTHEGQQGNVVGSPDSGPFLDFHEAVIENLEDPGSFKAKVHSTSTRQIINFSEVFEPPCTVRLEVYMPNG